MMDTLYIGETGRTALGRFWLAASRQGLVAVEWGKSRLQFEEYLSRRFKATIHFSPHRLRSAAGQLQEYLAGTRQVFSVVVDWSFMRPFQRSVLQVTSQIPYGQTHTYKQIAALVGRPGAARAVGRAEATNPMPLVIPCHRVIGSDGKLHGYGMAEGLKTKVWLLKLEGAMMA
jgi:methylated-DNA-[protein]-cysteine S-methyltransferase